MKSFSKKNVSWAVLWGIVVSLVMLFISCIGFYGFGVSDGIVYILGKVGCFLGLAVGCFAFGCLVEERSM